MQSQSPSPAIALLPFQAFGFAPIGRTRRQCQVARAVTIISLFQVAAILASAIFITGFIQTPSLQSIVAALIFAAEMLTNLVILVHAWATRHTQARIPVGLADIDRQLDAAAAIGDNAKLASHTPAPRCRLRCAGKIWLGAMVIAVAVCAELTSMWWRADPFLLSHSLQVIYPTVANRVRCLQTVLYADALRERLRRVARLVMAELGKCGGGGDQRQQQRLLQLKTAYAHIWRTADALNACFGWSLLAIITLYFIHLTAHGYWVFLTLEGQLERHQYVDSALGMAAVVVSLGLLCESCHGCTEEAAAIGGLLNKLGGRSGSDSEQRIDGEGADAMVEIVGEFLMQLQLEPIVVSASGFFDINRDLLAAVRRHRAVSTGLVLLFACCLQLAATTLTYLVILIQFQISEQNKTIDM